MLSDCDIDRIIALIRHEVVPAIGCTEPISVALCVAKAVETLGEKPERIEALLSANILKNAMGVGIPGTGMVGLPIAIALGALVGRSEYQLEVLRDSNEQWVELGKQFIHENRIKVGLKEDITEKLYIEVLVKANGHTAKAIISGSHTHFIYVEHDG
ncbi:MAG: serine dehydratase subunit alpha family protein, partial [Bacteroidaceae bacterium]|nr:serine dehydratase subunit alpha family protein [Bacteroidaceae bacterium]